MNTQKGNVLFLILIAVALFAALSFAVTSSSRGGGSNISKEQATLAASQVLQYASLIQQSITRLRLSNGTTLDTLSFRNTGDTNYDWNDTLDDDDNKIYHVDGGGLVWQDPPVESGATTYVIAGDVAVANVFNDTTPDVVLLLSGVNLEFCEAVNEAVGLSATPVEDTFTGGSTELIDSDDTSALDYGSTVTGNDRIGVEGGSSVQYDGQVTGCVADDSDPIVYTFYHVIAER